MKMGRKKRYYNFSIERSSTGILKFRNFALKFSIRKIF